MLWYETHTLIKNIILRSNRAVASETSERERERSFTDEEEESKVLAPVKVLPRKATDPEM